MTDPADHELEPARADAHAREDGWQMIDVRTPEELAEGHIRGSRHIELSDLTEAADSIPRDEPVIFVCRVGARSGMAVQAFRASGYEAYNLAGGVVAWAAAGLPLDAGSTDAEAG